MRKPDDIPQDAWKMADAALQNWLRFQGPTTREGFAHAIMDERERVLTIIEEIRVSPQWSGREADNLCEVIVGEIREGRQP